MPKTAKPTTIPRALQMTTVLLRNIDSGTIGCRGRRERRTKRQNPATATPAVASSTGDVQGKVVPPHAATRTVAVVQTASRPAPGAWGRAPVPPGVRRGPETTASTRARPPIGAFTQKIQRQPTVSV